MRDGDPTVQRPRDRVVLTVLGRLLRNEFGLATAVGVRVTPGSRGCGAATVEDPGYPAACRVLTRLGCQPVPVPVDEDGLLVARLAALPVAPPLVLATQAISTRWVAACR